MATFEEELEISFSSGPMSPSAIAPDGPKSGGGGGENASSSSSTSSFLSNLFDPSIVDPSYTSTDVPKFAPPSVILIEEIENVDRNGTIQIIDENNGTGTEEIDRVRYEHDVYFVLVVVTVSLTVLVMVTFAIYRIVENVMEGGGGGGGREHRGRRRDGRGPGRQGSASASTPAGSVPAPGGPHSASAASVVGNPQGHVGRAHSVEFLSGEWRAVRFLVWTLEILFAGAMPASDGQEVGSFDCLPRSAWQMSQIRRRCNILSRVMRKRSCKIPADQYLRVASTYVTYFELMYLVTYFSKGVKVAPTCGITFIDLLVMFDKHDQKIKATFYFHIHTLFPPGFFAFSRPFSNGRNSGSSSLQRRDAPPPYDDPPPYHVAVNMDVSEEIQEEEGGERSNAARKSESRKRGGGDSRKNSSSSSSSSVSVPMAGAVDAAAAAAAERGSSRDESDGRKMRVVSVMVV